MAKQKPVSQETVQRTKGMRPTPENLKKALDALDPELVKTALAEKARRDSSFVAKYHRISVNNLYNHVHAKGLGEVHGHEGTADVSQTNYGVTGRYIGGQQ